METDTTLQTQLFAGVQQQLCQEELMETVIIKSMLYPHPMICGNCKYRVPTKQKSYIRTLQALKWNEVPALGYCYCLNCGAKFIGIRDEEREMFDDMLKEVKQNEGL